MPAEAPAEAGVFAFKEEETFLPEETSAADTGMEEEAAAMGWLENLAAREGAQEEELLTHPEERSDSIPDWLQKLATETEVGEAVEAGESVEEMEPEPTAWQPEMESAGEVEGEPEPDAGELQMEPPAWQPEEVAAVEVISEPVEQSEEEIETGQATWQAEMETEAEMPAETATTLERDAELPEWLRDFAEEEAGPPVEEEVTAGESLSPPAEPVDFNTATLAQLERIPGIGYILAHNIDNNREAYGPIRSREDLEKVPGISPDDVDRLGQWGSFEEMEEISAPVEEPQEVLPEIESGEQPPVLEQAWGKLVSGEVTTAVDLYGELIRKEQHLDQVIHELREAAFLYPQEISIHQALGDAYLRANRLQEALDAYNKAEDLLK
jgi:DNA uptake protein ComE-like DNA-binding protein